MKGGKEKKEEVHLGRAVGKPPTQGRTCNINMQE